MSTDCAGRHVCEPGFYPAELGQRWTCPECGAEHRAFDVHAEYAGTPNEHILSRVPVGTLGWTTADDETLEGL